MSQEPLESFIRFERDGEQVEVRLEPYVLSGVGRGDTNAVSLTDKGASRDHAAIRLNASNQFVLIDLASTNGTWVNDRQVIAPTVLLSGDVIQIGQQRMTFVQPSEDPAEAAARGRSEFFVEQQMVSVLVLDIRDYTNLAMQMEAQRNTALTSYLLREIDGLLNEAKCMSIKHVAGATMALWGHTGTGPARADVVAALGVVRTCQDVFEEATKKFDPPTPLRFACGYSSGIASIGNLAGPGTPVVTARGDTVNIAFGLEAATEEASCDLLIAKTVFDTLSDRKFNPPNCTDITIKGITRPVSALPLRFGHIRWLSEQLRSG